MRIIAYMPADKNHREIKELTTNKSGKDKFGRRKIASFVLGVTSLTIATVGTIAGVITPHRSQASGENTSADSKAFISCPCIGCESHYVS